MIRSRYTPPCNKNYRLYINTEYLFRNNPQVGQQLIINDKNSVENSFWNPEHPTCIITHGWRGDVEPGSACALIRDGKIAINLNCSSA